MASLPPNPQNHGILERAFAFVKGLTFNNVLIIVILIFTLAPAYLMWSVLNDPILLGRFLSSYEEITSDKIPCTLRIASVRGAGDTYAVSTGFAYQGSDRWVVSVIMDRRPTDEEILSYCETLNLLIDFMRNPDARSPYFPGTEDPVVHMYPDEHAPSR